MPTLFVISPFGTKPVPQAASGELNFDAVYWEIIHPACERAGWKPLRSDDVPHAGLVTEQVFPHILGAEAALADISLPNPNVFYELGVRQAVNPGPTVLVAHVGTEIPFDLAWQRVRFYDPTQPEPTVQWLIEALHACENERGENPLRALLETAGALPTSGRGLADLEREISGRIERARSPLQLVAVWQWAKQYSPLPVLPLVSLAARLADAQDWLVAVQVMREAARWNPTDYEIHRQLGWYLQKVGPEKDAEAIECFQRALELNPQDPETLGMIGGLLKRQRRYPEAVTYYERGSRIAPESVYLLVNQAAVRVLERPEHPEAGVELYRKLLDKVRASDRLVADEWSELVLAESLFAIGDLAQARAHAREAARLATSSKSLRSAAMQLRLFAKAGFRAEAAAELAALLEQLAQPPPDVSDVQQPASPAAPSEVTLPVIIHLSDLHFGYAETDGRREEKHRFFDGENSQRLSQHLIDEFTRQDALKFDGGRIHLVVSGDLTYRGEEDEFEQVNTFLKEVCDGLHIALPRVHIVPGNHDVNWTAAKPRRFDDFLVFLERFYGEDLCRQRYPGISWPLRKATQVEPYQIAFVTYDASARLLFAGLNSCVYETEQHHYGFVGERQMRLVREQLHAAAAPRDALQVAIVHHHLHPFPELLMQRGMQEVWQDLSTVRDAGYVERALEKLGFDVVLHGHKHKPQMRETLVRDVGQQRAQRLTENRLIVCGAGSVGSVDLEHNESNHYQVIEVRLLPRQRETEFLRVYWRVLPVAAGAEWSTAQTWDVRG